MCPEEDDKYGEGSGDQALEGKVERVCYVQIREKMTDR